MWISELAYNMDDNMEGDREEEKEVMKTTRYSECH